MASISDLSNRPQILPAHSHVDERGTLLQVGELANLPYVNVKMSTSRRDVVRGMHYEVEPCLQAKIVRVCAGSIIDVALDLATGDLYEATLHAVSSAAFYVPMGYAHGYRALTDNVVVVYLCTNQYVSTCARAFSPLITHFPQFDWGGKSGCFHLSEQDRKADPYRFPTSAKHFRYQQGNWAPIGTTAK